MSANIFGDDDDDFVLPPGSDGSEPAIRTPPQRPAPQQGGGLPRTGGTSALPRRSGAAPRTTGLPPKSAGLPTRSQSSLPAVRRDTTLPPKQVTKALPPAVTAPPVSVPEERAYTKPTYQKPVREEPVYEEPVYEEPAYEEPVYEEPEESYEPEPEPEPEPVRTPTRREPPRREPTPDRGQDDLRAPQRYPSQRINSIRDEREFEYDANSMDERTDNRRNFNEAFGDSEPAKRRISEEVEDSRKGKGKKKTAKQVKKESKGEKKPSKYAGGRKSVLFVRIGAGLAVLALMGQGVNSLVNPAEFPTQQQFMSVVNENLGITEFPLDNGNAFVSSFVKEYMTIAPGDTERRTRLGEYATDSLVSTMSGGNAEVTQKITDGPIIVGSSAVDDKNAIYTVSVKVSGQWLYLAVPVFYDKDTMAFVVTGTPSFTSPPVKAEAPKYERKYEMDAKLAASITSNVESFFTAWGASDEEGLSRYTTKDADIETKAGLQGDIIFSKLTKFEVEAKDPADPTANSRKGSATVVWSNANDTSITFTQDYELELFQYPDERWYVADITGGVTEK